MTKKIFIQEKQTLKFLKQMSATRNETDEIDHLLSVEYVYDLYDSDKLGCLKAIIFDFELQSFTVKEVPDDATIEIVPGKIKPNSDQKLISASEDEPWSMVIGDFVGWTWALINNQGYPDAIQLEFIEDQPNRSTSAIIQLVSSGSSISIYELNEIES